MGYQKVQPFLPVYYNCIVCPTSKTVEQALYKALNDTCIIKMSIDLKFLFQIFNNFTLHCRDK